MSTILRLEYTCSDREREQAQTLSLRKRLGGGSKWRTRLVLLLVLVGMLLGAWFRFTEIQPAYRALMIAAVVAASVLFVFCKGKLGKRDPLPTKVEVSETGFTVLGSGSIVAMPWSVFWECLESTDLFVLVDRSKSTVFIVPKRVFPDEGWQTWFREHATNGVGVARPVWNELPALVRSTPADRITFTFRLGFRDFLGRTIASWLTWGLCLGVGCLILSISLYHVAHPPPDAVNSAVDLFLVFELPFFVVCVTMIILIFSVRSWLSHAKYNGPQELAISEMSVEFAGVDGSGTLPWTTFKYYKETPWSFIVWRGWRWIMFPKRAFASWDDLGRCREILNRNLQRSRWFVG